MSVDVALLVATAVLAAVALIAAVVAVHALRETRRLTRPGATRQPTADAATPSGAQAAGESVRPAPVPTLQTTPGRIVEGRIIVTPTSEQLAAATLNRPSVRGVSLARGVAHALRPESRDRIAALVRRSYRDRRRARLRAGRRAVRAAHQTPTPASELWLGEPVAQLETVVAGTVEVGAVEVGAERSPS